MGRHISMISADRFRDALKRSGLTQTALAARVGVSQQTIAKLAQGRISTSRRLHLIARELGTTSAYLTGETENPKSEVPDFALSSAERELVTITRSLSAPDRAAILHLARSLAADRR